MKRRAFLSASAGGLAAVSGGCLNRLGFQTQSAWRDPPLVQDRPEGVYYPAITEGMAKYGTTTAGPYTIALMYSYPHRFWQVSGSQLQKTVVESDDSVHLMATIWDAQSGTVVPVGDLSAEITRNGELVSEEVIYPMLSQQMGFHYGANFPLTGDGTYRAAISIGGTQMARTGRFSGHFETPRTATFGFDFRSGEMHNLEIRRLGEKAGTRGAVSPMDMGIPVGRARPVKRLPGTSLGEQTSGDAVIPLRAVQNADTTRLAAFPRTPYNRIVLPLMGLEARVERNGRTMGRTELARTLDPQLGYHYANAVSDLRAGDRVELVVTTPPQVARHDGYETAFLEMNSLQFAVPDSFSA